MKAYVAPCVALLAALFLAAVPAAARQARQARQAPPARPNVLLVLIDDMGERDVGCYGSTYYETPELDRLAAQGMRFTQAYSACCVCSPTRAALLTGRSPARLHLTDWIPGHKRPAAKLAVPAFHTELPAAETTLAELFMAAGYATASVGKWHLGGPGSYPDRHGFDLNVGGTEKGSPPSYFSPYKIPTLADGPPGEYLTDRLTTEAERFIEANRDKPFFLYVPHYTVHTPIQPRKDLLAKYQAKVPAGEQKNPAYAAMVESMDQSVGRLLGKLDELKLAERTIVVFTSDNGGLSGRDGRQNGPTSNAPLRAGKGTPYEGGVRVPLIVRYPAAVKPGTTSPAPVISQDLFPTLRELAGLAQQANGEQPAPGDGVSIVPLVKGSGPIERDALYWHYPHYHPGGATPCATIRQGDWKLTRYFEDGRVELFDLKADPYEKNDLAKADPGRAAALAGQLDKWLKDVNAQMPTPNPNHDPAAAR